jgi:putative FmdB family regulatory protein
VPIREYTAVDPQKGCSHCRERFEEVESIHAPALEACPRCGAKVRRCFSAPNVGGSKSGLDDRAKSAGFTKYEKLGKGEYEKKY